MRSTVLALLVVTACGGGTSAPSAPPATTLVVSGSYQVRSATLNNGCGIPLFLTWEGPAIVRQRGDLIEVEAGVLPLMQGTVGLNGNFSVASATFDTEADPKQTRLAGTFTRDGLDATFQYRRTAAGSGELCISSARWDGDKQGEPNSIPG